jgi:hypothetical protein
MMSAVQVVRQLTPSEARASVAEQDGLEIASSAYASTRVPALRSPKQFALYCRLHGIRVVS